MSKHVQRLIIMMALCALLLMSTIAFAQEATEAVVAEPAAVSEELPLGGGTLVLLLGIGFLLLVGGISYFRERGADTSLPKS